MSKIEEMLDQMCPEGVEFKRIDGLVTISRGEQFNKRDMIDGGEYPVLNGGVDFSGFTDSFNEDANTITISQGGASAGYVNWVEKKFWAGAHCYIVKLIDDSILDKKYLFYYLKNVEKKLMESKQGAGIPGLSRAKVYDLEVPVPPIEVQREVVKVLDSFAELIAALTAELSARKKQYEFYRKNLLAFDPEDDTVEWPTVRLLFDMRNGYTPSKSNSSFWNNGTIPWFRMEDIRENGRVLYNAIQSIHPSAVKRKGLFKANSIILATSATIGEHALVKVDCLTNQRFTCLTPKASWQKKIDIKYIYFYMFLVDDWCKAHINQGNFAGVDMVAFSQLQIPIPTLTEQKKIVAILEKLEALTTSLSEGLPAEIKARQKQYEYYRDQLLTFKRAN